MLSSYTCSVLQFSIYQIKIESYFEEGEEKKQLVNLIVNHLKKDYVAWNKDGVEDTKILEDLYELSDGKIKCSIEDVRFFEQRTFNSRRRPANNNQSKKKYNNQNQ